MEHAAFAMQCMPGFMGHESACYLMRINQSDAMAELNQPLSEELQQGDLPVPLLPISARKPSCS